MLNKGRSIDLMIRETSDSIFKKSGYWEISKENLPISHKREPKSRNRKNNIIIQIAK
jgi:hypothetical protein